MSSRACMCVCAIMVLLCPAPSAGAYGGGRRDDQGDRNAVSQQVSAAAILAAASGSVKAALAASVGNRAASTSALSKGSSLLAFDSIPGVLGRKLAGHPGSGKQAVTSPGSGEQARTSVAGGTTYFDAGDRTITAQQNTGAAIQAAVLSGKAQLASYMGLGTARTATRRSAGPKAFDSISRRKLAGHPGSGEQARTSVAGGTTYFDAGDRTITAQQNTGAAIQAAVLSGKAQLASYMGLGTARTATRRSAGPKAFDSIGRRKLAGHPGSGEQARTSVAGGTTYFDAGDRTITAQQNTGAAIQAAVLSGKAQLASYMGLGTARTATRRSAGPKAFDSIGRRKLLQLAAY